ncbi:23S rRNA (guanine(745)-N(1))-methyltransferase [Propionigenium maris DSM 9537]|uniref:23S rRNA (Guanine(745)-N(1))-methyltransferase n=1 Tax=Propionigenium maris DSM 9537 TaxID=1123000 RepID=A0A9W6GI71_9FUSO|nr:methyltransferase domain-containing protein [Propionigenium maris]GLI55658.1 23S rRNA (guanine(745)-N(1))-methyltransferase [Propionigenium maris DSM 9537]
MSILICPICKGSLEREGRTYRCPKNHSFDMAKQGYVNLHISNKKNSGDDKEMIQSRRDFLEKDYYKKISEEVNEVTGRHLGSEKPEILDIGCGEGYYTKHLKNHLEDMGKKSNIYGIDISKEAVLFASRSYKDIFWAVGSAADLPMSAGSLDAVVCMFSRLAEEEYSRVLKDDGILVVVSTGEDHLLDMKKVLYDEVRMEYYRPEVDLAEEFQLKETKNVKYRTLVEGSKDIMSLFDMTPYKWRTPKEGVERLAALEELDVTIDVNIDVFVKRFK